MGAPPPPKTLPLVRLPAVLPFIIALILAIGVNAQESLETPKLELTPWNVSVKYVSSTEYNARGMAPLYKLTQDIIRWFIDDDEPAIPEDYIIVTEGRIEPGQKVQNSEWGELLKYYWGLLLVIALTALVVVLMPIIGLCFCCCRCAGACGGRSQPFDKKHDTCRRAFLGLLLICTTTGILFGVVVAFVTNSYMQEGLDDSTNAARKGSEDAKTFLQTTSLEIDYLLVKNYKEFSNHLEVVWRDTANSVIDDLESNFKAPSLKYLGEFVEKLPKMKEDLEHMKVITNELRVSASQLSDGLRSVKRELLVTLTKCTTKACKDVLDKYEIGKLDASGIDYNQLPDLGDIINGVSNLLKDENIRYIGDGNKNIERMRAQLNKIVEDSIDRVSVAMQSAGQSSKSASEEIAAMLHNIANFISNNTEKGTNIADFYIEKYGMYRFYIGVAVSSVLLLILVCLVISLFCGICGKRPEGYGDDCCNKGAGARFLMLAITVIFLTISILAAVALIHFLVGLVLQRGICVPLRNPENDQIFDYIDNFVDLNKVIYKDNKKSFLKVPKVKEVSGTMPPFRISHVIVDCKKNQSLYKILRLDNHIDISEILNRTEDYKIEDAFKKLKNGLDSESKIEVINPEIEQSIQDLKKSDLKDFDSDKFVDNLKDNITKHSLSDIARKLKEIANNITSSKMSEMSDVYSTLSNQALHLDTYQEKLVNPMTERSKELLDLATKLERQLRYKDKRFEESLDILLKEIKDAQHFINNQRQQFVENAAHRLIDVFRDEINRYVNYVLQAILWDVGNCAPMMNVYDSLIVAGCNRIVDPFNGFWAGVGWCVILFLPTLVISIKLSTLYQKSDPYPGPLVESEYLYDAYSERDNIPLANGPKDKRRKAKNRRRGSRDRRGDYYEDSGSSHGAPAGRDTRYSDMAPRHWDGGPPRYQNPPMAPPASEYERPPPYYYPGAPSEQE